MRPVGILANPASGKDIRRLVAHASVFDNNEKVNIVRRALIGIASTGVRDVLYMPDYFGIVERARDGLELPLRLTPAAIPRTAAQEDTTASAAWMAEEGAAVLLTLGGDGTNRAAAKGTCDVPLVAISTGTNNVFPAMVEGTVAGLAAGAIASGEVAAKDCAFRSKRIAVRTSKGGDDTALIDVAAMQGSFVGARALWEEGAIRQAVLTRALPAAVGMAALGGALAEIPDSVDAGLSVRLAAPDEGIRVSAAIGPGLIRSLYVESWRMLELGESEQLEGPCVLAFDGERELVLRAGDWARVAVERSGPPVVDIDRCLGLLAERRRG